jgi:hypothetical protein
MNVADFYDRSLLVVHALKTLGIETVEYVHVAGTRASARIDGPTFRRVFAGREVSVTRTSGGLVRAEIAEYGVLLSAEWSEGEASTYTLVLPEAAADPLPAA